MVWGSSTGYGYDGAAKGVAVKSDDIQYVTAAIMQWRLDCLRYVSYPYQRIL